MSHLVSNKDLKQLSEYLKYIQTSLIDKDMISEMLEYLLPKSGSKLLVDYDIKESGNYNDFNAPAYYFPVLNTVYIKLDEIIEWVEINLKLFSEAYDIDENSFRAYVLLYLIIHELEHSYQGLIRLNLMKAPCRVVNDGYKTFMDLLVDSNKRLIDPVNSVVRNIRLRNYYKKQENFVLERNANLEASMTMLSLALYMEDEKATKVFDDSTRAYSVLGYEKGIEGSMLQTYKELYYYSKYKKINKKDIKDKYRVRFGLEISEENRKELIKKCSRSYNKFFR